MWEQNVCVEVHAVNLDVPTIYVNINSSSYVFLNIMPPSKSYKSTA